METYATVTKTGLIEIVLTNNYIDRKQSEKNGLEPRDAAKRRKPAANELIMIILTSVAVRFPSYRPANRQ